MTMILDFPFPPAELWPAELLMDVAEIEEFAPLINSEAELDDDATLQDALSVPGGMAAFAHRQRLRDEENNLTAISSHRRK